MNAIVPHFKVHSYEDETASKAAGRPIFRELEVVEIRFAGDKQTVAVFPAHDPDPDATREAGSPVTYAMRYNKQYLAFKNQTTQSLSGTPLEELTFLTQSRRMELKALNIHTAEALAALDGAALKRVGPGGRDLKNQAQAYIDKAAGSADVTAMAARIAELERRLAERDAQPQEASQPDDEDDDDDPAEPAGEKSLEDCTDAELKAFIKRESGQSVRGNPSRETLIERAMELATAPDDAGE